jgi:hypothetical protein
VMSQCSGGQVYKRIGKSGCLYLRNVGKPAQHKTVLLRKDGNKIRYSSAVSWVVALCNLV